MRLPSRTKAEGIRWEEGVLLAFTDNGEPGVGLDTQVTYPTAGNPTVCPVPLFEYQPELPLIDGNYVVRDVQP